MHQDLTGLKSEFEWMLQSSDVDDALLTEALIHKYYPELYQLTLSVTGDPGAAASAAGQAITSAVAKRHRYTGEYSLRVWLYALGYRSTRKSKVNHQPAALRENPDGGKDLGTSDQLKYLHSLDNKYSLPVNLRYVHRLDLREIGHILGLRERAVHNRLNSARRQVLAILYPGSEKEPPHPEMGELMRESLDGMFEGKNSFEYQARLEMHLDECRECTAYSALLSKVDEQIRVSAPQLWPVIGPSEAELKAVQAEILERTGRKHRRQSLSLSLKTLSLAAMVVALFTLAAFTTDIFETVFPERTVPMGAGSSLSEQATPEAAGSGNTRYRPRPTGVGPTTRRDGYPLLTGAYLPPRINLRLTPPGAILPQIIDRLAWNNSGPLSLYNVLGYWGWQGELEDVLAELQPDLDQQHVTPEEIVAYIYRETELSSLWRVGGDLETLKLVVAGGYPVIVAKGAEDGSMPGWFAHYAIVHGYNDKEGVVRLVDLMLPETEMQDLPYEDFIRDWRSMNYTFLVLYPTLQEQRIFELLGDYADEVYSFRAASRLGSNESRSLSGRDKFFAAFNHGTSHAYLGEYSRAASAFNEAMTIYLSLPESERPWRILWYETAPYTVYQDVYVVEDLSQPRDIEMGYEVGIHECLPGQGDMSAGRGGGGDLASLISTELSERNLLRLLLCTQPQ